MTTTKQRIIVLVLATLLAAFAVFAGTSTVAPVNDSGAAIVAPEVKAKAE